MSNLGAKRTWTMICIDWRDTNLNVATIERRDERECVGGADLEISDERGVKAFELGEE